LKWIRNMACLRRGLEILAKGEEQIGHFQENTLRLVRSVSLQAKYYR